MFRKTHILMIAALFLCCASLMACHARFDQGDGSTVEGVEPSGSDGTVAPGDSGGDGSGETTEPGGSISPGDFSIMPKTMPEVESKSPAFKIKPPEAEEHEFGVIDKFINFFKKKKPIDSMHVIPGGGSGGQSGGQQPGGSPSGGVEGNPYPEDPYDPDMGGKGEYPQEGEDPDFGQGDLPPDEWDQLVKDLEDIPDPKSGPDDDPGATDEEIDDHFEDKAYDDQIEYLEGLPDPDEGGPESPDGDGSGQAGGGTPGDDGGGADGGMPAGPESDPEGGDTEGGAGEETLGPNASGGMPSEPGSASEGYEDKAGDASELEGDGGAESGGSESGSGDGSGAEGGASGSPAGTGIDADGSDGINASINNLGDLFGKDTSPWATLANGSSKEATEEECKKGSACGDTTYLK